MSYLRYAWDHKYVEGTSDDYIYDNGTGITDYGDITNEGLVEIICERIEQSFSKDQKFIKEYLKKKIAERLKVKLRPRPLKDELILERMLERLKKVERIIKNER